MSALTYRPRVVDAQLDEYSALPAVAIDGPKGVGKTVTAARPARTVLCLDDPGTLAIIQAGPVPAWSPVDPYGIGRLASASKHFLTDPALAAALLDVNADVLPWLKEKMGADLTDMVILTTGTSAYRRQDGVAVIPLSLLGP